MGTRAHTPGKDNTRRHASMPHAHGWRRWHQEADSPLENPSGDVKGRPWGLNGAECSTVCASRPGSDLCFSFLPLPSWAVQSPPLSWRSRSTLCKQNCIWSLFPFLPLRSPAESAIKLAQAQYLVLGLDYRRLWAVLRHPRVHSQLQSSGGRRRGLHRRALKVRCTPASAPSGDLSG